MVTTTPADQAADDLADVLTRIAGDAGRTGHLHEMLGGYCHQFRNLLNCLKMSMYLARRGTDPAAGTIWLDLEGKFHSVEQYIDRIQFVCRPMPLALVRLPINLLFDERKPSWTRTLAEHGKRLIVDPPPEPAVGAFDPNRLGVAFDHLVEWRARLGRGGANLRVAWSVQGGEFHVVWRETGRKPTRARSAAAAEPEPFESLTIPLLNRIVTLHGGSLDVVLSGDWRLEIRWPLDARTT